MEDRSHLETPAGESRSDGVYSAKNRREASFPDPVGHDPLREPEFPELVEGHDPVLTGRQTLSL